jgi:hypothetical protein
VDGRWEEFPVEVTRSLLAYAVGLPWSWGDLSFDFGPVLRTASSRAGQPSAASECRCEFERGLRPAASLHMETRNTWRNHPETDRLHEGSDTDCRTSPMLTSAVLTRLAVSLICVATISAPALLVA